MVDSTEALSKARKAVTDRAELPGMSLMEHLDELRRRIVHSAAVSRRRLPGGVVFSRPNFRISAGAAHAHRQESCLHAPDGCTQFQFAGIAARRAPFIASPFILYQVWLFIAPGLYQKEKRFVIPFMAATVGLFLAGASFGYFTFCPAPSRFSSSGSAATSPR